MASIESPIVSKEVAKHEDVTEFARSIVQGLFKDDPRAAQLAYRALMGKIKPATDEENEWNGLLATRGREFPVTMVPVNGAKSIVVPPEGAPQWIATNQLNGCMATVVFMEDAQGVRTASLTHFPKIVDTSLTHQAGIINNTLPVPPQSQDKKGAVILASFKRKEGALGLKKNIQELLGDGSSVQVQYYKEGLAEEGNGVVIVSVPPKPRGEAEYRVRLARVQNRRALPSTIASSQEYLQQIDRHTSTRSAIDRSKFFRYPQDLLVIESEAERILKTPWKLDMLEIGVGNLEESVSYVGAVGRAAAKSGKSIEDALTLSMVELRKRSDVQARYSLGKQPTQGVGLAFLSDAQKQTTPLKPISPPPGTEDLFTLSTQSGEYEFRGDIRAMVDTTMNDPAHSSFGTPVEEFLVQNRRQYDVVACNNVLQHMGGIEGYDSPYKNPGKPMEAYTLYLKHLLRLLESVRPGGVLILHTDGSTISDTKGRATATVVSLIDGFSQQFEEISPGIFRRREPVTQS